MARNLFAGTTDYSHQSIDDIVEDLKDWTINISDTIKVVNNKIDTLKSENDYWDKRVYVDFKSIVNYSLDFFRTAEKEIKSITNKIPNQVKDNHISRLKRLGVTARKLDLDIGKLWNGEYPNELKDYKSDEYRVLESIYSQIRDMVIDLIDLLNVQERLSDFVDSSPSQSLTEVKNKSGKFKVFINFFRRKEFITALIVGLIIFSLGLLVSLKDKSDAKIVFEQEIQLILERADSLLFDKDYEGVINLLNEFYIQGDIVKINNKVKSFYYGLVKKYEASAHYALANSTEDINEKKEHYNKAISSFKVSSDNIEPNNVAKHDERTKELLFSDFIYVNLKLGEAYFQSALLEEHPAFKLGNARDAFLYLLGYIDPEKNNKAYGDIKKRLGLVLMELSLYVESEENFKNAIINISEAENTVETIIAFGDNGPLFTPPFYLFPELYNYIIRQGDNNKKLLFVKDTIDSLYTEINKDDYPHTYFDLKLTQAVISKKLFLINENYDIINNAFSICEDLINDYSYQDKPLLYSRASYIKTSLSFVDIKNKNIPDDEILSLIFYYDGLFFNIKQDILTLTKDKYPFDYALLKELEGDINYSGVEKKMYKNQVLESVKESYNEASGAFIEDGWLILSRAMIDKIANVDNFLKEDL